jgi:hypothetical protein
VVPFHPRPIDAVGELGGVSGRGALEVDPSDLGSRRAHDDAAEGLGEHLGAEADPEDRLTALVGRPQQRRLGRHERRGPLPVHVPARSERHQKLGPVERRPAVRALPGQLDELDAVVAEAVPDEAGLEADVVVGVADDEATHAPDRTDNGPWPRQ